LARPSALPDTIPDELNERLPRVDYFGAGLASVLYYLVETANPMLDSIVERVAAVIDGFEGFDSTLSPQIESASRLDSTTPAALLLRRINRMEHSASSGCSFFSPIRTDLRFSASRNPRTG
jgi:hypothetical protein